VPDIRLFADEQISNAIILGLRQRGIEVLSVPDADRIGMSDESHLVFARDNDYVVQTQDKDFLVLCNLTKNHSGVIFAPQSMSIGDTIHGVLVVTGVLTDTEMKGRLEYL